MRTNKKKSKELELDGLLKRPRNKRKINFGRNMANISFDRDNSHYLIMSGSDAGIVLSGSNIISSGSNIGISGSASPGSVLIQGGISFNGRTSFSDNGNTLHIGQLGATKGYSLVPTVALPITTFDTITDLRNVADGSSVAGTATGLITDGQGGGEIIKLGVFDSGINTKGMAISLTDNGGTLHWRTADADVSSGVGDATALLGAALDVDGGADEGLVLLRGYVRIDSSLMNNFNGATTDIGQPVYLSTTAGEYDMDPPTGNNDIARIVGYMIDTDGTDHLIYFSPSNDWVKVSA